MLMAPEYEENIIWLDVDVVFLSDGVGQTMIAHSENTKDAGIITARCHWNQMENCDMNAWRVGDGNVQGAISNDERAESMHKLVETRVMVDRAIMGTGDSEIVPLDNVGGTSLYICPELVREGVVFSYFNIV
jgi:hypothetical protein